MNKKFKKYYKLINIHGTMASEKKSTLKVKNQLRFLVSDRNKARKLETHNVFSPKTVDDIIENR